MISAGPGARRTMSPLGATTVSGTWQVARESRVLEHVADLAMDRHGDLRAGPSGTSAPARRGRMAGDVDDGRRRR